VTSTYVSVDEGADRKLHGVERIDGPNTVVQYLYVTAEPHEATYSAAPAAAASVSTAVAADHLFQLMAGASLRVGLRRVILWQNGSASAAAAPRWQLRRVTSAGTGGTAATPVAHDPADPAAGATFMTLPSSKGTEGGYFMTGNMYLTNTVTSKTEPVLDLDFTRERGKPLWIAAGTSNGIVLKLIDAVASATVHIWVEFVESGITG
jgi:hypothetical protein